MPTVALFLAVFAAVTLGVLAVGRYVAARPTRDQRRAGSRLRELAGDAPDEAAAKPDGGPWEVLRDLGTWLLPWHTKQSADLGARLALAGYRHPSAVSYYTGVQLVLVCALAGGVGAVAVFVGMSWPKVLLWGAAGGATGLLAPATWLSNAAGKRQRLIRNALPDAIDVMVLSVEGGASLNAAVNWVAEEIPPVHPILGAELVVVEREIQLGLSAGEAFRAFADRCGIPEAKDLAGAIMQSEKYGASVAKVLRAYSDAARQERQLWAEEVAQKASVKILFPMLLCIFPAMFIVLLGPAAFQMSKIFAR